MRLQKLSLVAVLGIGTFGFAQGVAAQNAGKERLPGGSATMTQTASATVKAIDPAKRTITLQKENGDVVVLKCGADVRNFDQIKVGDKVKAASISRLVIAVGGGNGTSPNDGGATIIARTPKGATPGIIIANTEQATVKIDSIDAANQTVTLTGLDGESQVVQVAPDVDLTRVKVGDDVKIQVTKGIALWVAKPGVAEPAPSADSPQAKLAAFEMEGSTRTATVASIDKDKRLVTLKTPDGFTRTIHLGKECINFDQIEVGDKVQATLADEVAVSVSKGGAAPSADAARMVLRGAEGSKPRVIIADSETVTGKVNSIDAAKNTITITEPDGDLRTVKAGPDVKLSELNAGDDITVRVTQALGIMVEKP